MQITLPPPQIGGGGIVTVPDQSGGVGAAVTTAQIINAMWENAMARTRDAVALYNATAQEIDPGPAMVVAGLNTAYDVPEKPDLVAPDPEDAEALFESERARIMREIEDGFRSFINEFFPHPDFYEDAAKWCDDAIVQGGSGIRPAVEQALLERDRARIQVERSRAEDQVVNEWAGKRFPLPPGAMMAQLAAVRRDALVNLAASSRDAMIKSWETEIENVKFAVTKMLDQRQVALQAAGDYIKALVMGPDIAMRLATGLAGLRSDFMRATATLYSAEVAALEPGIRLLTTDAELKERAREANLRADSATQDARVRAALGAAQLMATEAAAGINAINAGAKISGSDQSSV